MARIVAMIVVVAFAAMPAGALGATGGGLTPQPAPQPLLQNQVEEAPAPAPASEAPPTTSEGRIGPGELLLIGLAVVLLLGGIWFAITRDMRRVTGGGSRTQPAGGGGAGLGAGGSTTRARHRSRRLSAAERRRRKRGKAR